MAVIGQRVFAGNSTNYLTLGNEEFVRPLAIGNNWNVIRIVMQCAIRSTGVPVVNGSLVMGVCSGTTNTYASTSTTNFAGVIFGNGGYDITRNYAYTSGASAYYNPYYEGCLWQRVGSVTSVLGPLVPSSGPKIATAGDGTARRGALLVTIGKSSVNTFSTAYDGSWNAATDFSDLYALAESGSLNGALIATNSYVNTAISEVAGALNTLNLFWNTGGLNTLEIYGIAVMRLA